MKMKTIKEYRCFLIGDDSSETEEFLNDLAKEGWKLICAYSKHNYYLIMERDKKVCVSCGGDI